MTAEPRDYVRRGEREHVRSQLYHGRSPADLHRVVDQEVVDYVRKLRGHGNRARLAEARLEILRSAVISAAGYLRQISGLGSIDSVVEELDRALHQTSDQPQREETNR